jgi:hypothetical protein
LENFSITRACQRAGLERTQLAGTRVVDPAIVAALLIVLSVVASYVPVRRAMRRPLREVLLSH